MKSKSGAKAQKKRRQDRQAQAKPLIETFEVWVNDNRARVSKGSRLGQALSYIAKHMPGLKRYLDDGRIEIDNNAVENTIRPIAMGRKNWLFCTTEMGAEQVATIQTLLATCRAHGIDPYTYLVDVMQRINQRPASKVHELTPRLWAQRFADNPLKSDLQIHCQ